MSGMTCGNGFVFVAAICIGLMATSARGGSLGLDATSAPTNPASAMWTLANIYNVLDTRTTNVTKRTGGFTEPTAGPTNGTMHTLNEIMTLATNRAPVQKTRATNTYVVGDDGTTQIGVAWPNPRFSPVATNGAATNQIRDNLTGLIWARNANLASNTTWATWWSFNGTCSWYQACDVITNSAGPVNGANYGGTNDWRLPNLQELQSLVTWQYQSPPISDGTGTNQWTEARGPFTRVQSSYYWTSTAYGTDQSWWMQMATGGYIDNSVKTSPFCYMWPVRGGGQ